MQSNEEFTAFELFLRKYGIDLSLLLSGFFGAFLLALKSSKGQHITTTIATIFAGTACANYLTPLVLYFVPDSIQERAKFGVAFLMGFLGLKGLEMIINLVTKKLKGDKIKIDISM